MFDTEFQEIAKLRETKGKEAETLSLISELEPRVVASNDLPSICKLQWEKAFVYQHLLMSRENSEVNLKLMEEAALRAHQIITDNQLSDLTGDDTRFLGRVYDYKKEYGKAFSFYQQALEYYQSTNHPRVLEINAFICSNLIYQGKLAEGIELAQKTYSEFEASPIKAQDFYTWAVWKTGLYPRIVTAIKENNLQIDTVEIKQKLEADKLLLTQSNLNFQFRLDEINNALNLITII